MRETQTCFVTGEVQHRFPASFESSLAGGYWRQSSLRMERLAVSQSFYSDWERQGRMFLSARMAEEFSYLTDDDSDDDEAEEEDDFLSYIPTADDEWELPPLTRRLLYRATLQYVQGNNTVGSFPIQTQEVISVIEQEYDSFDVPVKVGNTTYESGDVLDQSVVKILSFAALYAIPKEIVIVLLGPVETNEKNALTTCQSILRTHGWTAVDFPKGLGIHVRRTVAKQYGERFARPSWPWQRRQLVKLAQELVEDASYAEPPRQRLMSEKEFLKSLSEELTETAIPVIIPESRLKGLAFFPNHNHNGLLQRIRRSIQQQVNLMKTAELLKSAGRAGTLSYGFLNFAFYASGVLFQWRRLKVGYSGSTLTTSLSKLGRVFGTVYLASQVTKLPRMLLALALAPFGDRALHITRKKLRVSENTAFAILTGALLGIFFAVLTAIVLGDMASRNILRVV